MKIGNNELMSELRAGLVTINIRLADEVADIPNINKLLLGYASNAEEKSFINDLETPLITKIINHSKLNGLCVSGIIPPKASLLTSVVANIIEFEIAVKMNEDNTAIESTYIVSFTHTLMGKLAKVIIPKYDNDDAATYDLTKKVLIDELNTIDDNSLVGKFLKMMYETEKKADR